MRARLASLLARAALAGLLAPLGAAARPAPGQTYGAGQVTYLDVAGQVGLVLSHELSAICGPPVGSGSAWADYDADGDLDLYVTNHGGPNRLYRNEGDTDLDGLPDFADTAASLGIDQPALAGHSAVFVDYDNDADQDLFVTNWGSTTLFQNQLADSGSAAFVDVTAAAGVADGGRVNTAAWGDFDQDGRLDLYLAKHQWCSASPLSQDRLFHNNGDGSFSDVTGWLCPGGTAPCAQVLGLAFSAGWLDYDNDGDPDLYLVNDNIQQLYYPNVLWRNDGPDGAGGWIFSDVSAAAGTNQSINGMGLGVGDYDNDGWLDLSFSNIGPNYLLRNRGDGGFDDVSAAAGIERSAIPGQGTSITWGTVFFDGDNDGWLDLFFSAGLLNQPGNQPDAYFGNNQDGTFTDLSAASGLDDARRGRNVSIADFDRDGFVDVFVGNYGEAPGLFHNQGNDNHWLAVTVVGTASSADAIGARLWLTTPDGLTQLREITSGATYGGGDERAAYFGLGQAATGTLVVRWPSGLVQDLGVVAAGQRLHLVEPALVPTATPTPGTPPAPTPISSPPVRLFLPLVLS